MAISMKSNPIDDITIFAGECDGEPAWIVRLCDSTIKRPHSQVIEWEFPRDDAGYAEAFERAKIECQRTGYPVILEDQSDYEYKVIYEKQ